MHLIVGLGNPGPEYAGSRHNLGFQVVETLSRKLKTGQPVLKHRSLTAVAVHRGCKIMLAQPLTFMNLSGRAVKELIGNYGVDRNRVLIIYDDLDLPPGVIRLRSSGGSGGHRGLESIINYLGTSNFPRMRIGIGRTPQDMDTADYVLLPPAGPEQVLLEEAIETAVEAVLCFVEQGLEAAMNAYNRVAKQEG